MSSRAKARAVGVLLLAVMVWPLFHRVLVVRYDVNPWKLFGFAMYCTPHSVAVDLIDRSGARAREIERQALPLPLREAYDRFAFRRGTLGALHPPDRLARRVLEAFPEVERLSVAVTVSQLPFGGSRLRSRTTFHGYDRDRLRRQ